MTYANPLRDKALKKLAKACADENSTFEAWGRAVGVVTPARLLKLQSRLDSAKTGRRIAEENVMFAMRTLPISVVRQRVLLTYAKMPFERRAKLRDYYGEGLLSGVMTYGDVDDELRENVHALSPIGKASVMAALDEEQRRLAIR
jgi:hypothetical protein